MYFDWIEADSTMPRLLHWVIFQRNIVMCKRERASACYEEGMLSYQCTYDRAFASRNTHSLSYPVSLHAHALTHHFPQLYEVQLEYHVDDGEHSQKRSCGQGFE